MRVLILVSALGALLGFATGSYASEYAMTPSQKHFTAIIKGLPGVVGAEWESAITLKVYASAKALGSPAKADKAQRLGDILAERGRTALKQPFCVWIYQSAADRELARSCTYY
ncbi:MAG: hypothetical protein ACT4NX_05055 [Deltaproteobacteria bacterium]